VEKLVDGILLKPNYLREKLKLIQAEALKLILKMENLVGRLLVVVMHILIKEILVDGLFRRIV